ncbi:nucleoid DNA-binding protein [Xanthomonas sacchari]|uniref:HU family DNA-binding protein n=1 Tax=Xanthomonas sacchari TaxID=56458 RepID=UPI0027816AFF|nr:HU family DNA-binding protein [Xanthomonas sacchari]MDQ1090668.1 nucleoid DNA-binding protein [Xanthomonas sacchari]
MNKSALASAIAHRHAMTLTEATSIVDTVTEVVALILVEHGRVNINRFGRFRLQHKLPRQARNPKTGETVQVGLRVAVQFTAADELKRRLLVSKHGDGIE